MSKVKVLELFAGIGACSKALTNLGIEYEIVDAVEIDKYAIKSFNAIHGTNFEPQDITKWDKHIDCDLIMHGSPCQDFSVAGLQAGGDKHSGTRSSLMYETLRIVEKLKPRYVIWENVKNLISKTHKHNFDNYLQIMKSLGYVNHHKLINAKDYGVPQNRERVFVVSIRNDIVKDFKFPNSMPLTRIWRDYETDEEKFCVNKTPSRDIMRSKCKNITNEKCCSTISLKQDRWSNAGIIDYKDYYRFLTPKECWRLMGFSDSDYEKASKVCSETQLYKQAGNSIVVNVLQAILKELLNESNQ